MSSVIDKESIRAELEASLDKHCKTFATREPNSRVWAVETQLDEKYQDVSEPARCHASLHVHVRIVRYTV